ncbi:NADPH-dependent FMN reductase [Fulvivirga imtechensis]|nr:NAD(P)H-dependent oxidoreductase [Fulvivirga imtechensis]
MNEKKRVLAISGSTKKNSTNEIILRKAAALAEGVVDVELFDGIDKLPHFNPDQDGETPPAVVQKFRNSIAKADGVLICTPEYVFSLPGSLKNAIEWTVSTTVFSNKPVAIIVAAASGEKAFEALDLIITTIEGRIDEGSKLLIKGARGKIGRDGEIQDDDTLARIKNVMGSLIAAMEAEHAIPTKYRH